MPTWLNALASPSGLALAFLKSSLIIGTAAAVTYALRKNSSAALYLVWTAAMLLVILCVVAPWFPWRYQLPTPQLLSIDSSTQSAPPARLATATPAPRQLVAPLRAPAPRRFDWTRLISVSWLLGAGLLLWRMIVARIQLAHISHGSDIASGALRQTFNVLLGNVVPNRPVLCCSVDKWTFHSPGGYCTRALCYPSRRMSGARRA